MEGGGGGTLIVLCSSLQLVVKMESRNVLNPQCSKLALLANFV